MMQKISKPRVLLASVVGVVALILANFWLQAGSNRRAIGQPAVESTNSVKPANQATTPPASVAGPASKDHLIRVTGPKGGELVQSPLVVSGEARGNWYFEASFPVQLLDANGTELAILPAQAQAEWMTTEFVPFSVTLTFAPPATSTGTLVLKKDNPSGLPEYDDELLIPVRFE